MPSRHLFAATLLTCAFAANAQSSCSSDGVPRPVVVLERFTNADCESCWADAAVPQPGRNEVALDWIVPGSKGEDAPLSAAATRDASDRLEALHLAAPEAASSLRTRAANAGRHLRIAQGLAFNDYIGTSIESKGPQRAGWSAWLLLIEQIPAGTEGSAVARNLVRNVFVPQWPKAAAVLWESRSMQIPQGAKPDRLRLAALLYDRAGRLATMALTDCR